MPANDRRTFCHGTFSMKCARAGYPLQYGSSRTYMREVRACTRLRVCDRAYMHVCLRACALRVRTPWLACCAAGWSPQGGRARSESVILRQLRLPLRGAWALTSSGLPWAGPGDLTTHHVTNCNITDSDPYACRRRPRDPNGIPGPPAGRWSYATTYHGTACRGTLRVPQAASGPMELIVDALLPRRIRPY